MEKNELPPKAGLKGRKVARSQGLSVSKVKRWTPPMLDVSTFAPLPPAARLMVPRK